MVRDGIEQRVTTIVALRVSKIRVQAYTSRLKGKKRKSTKRQTQSQKSVKVSKRQEEREEGGGGEEEMMLIKDMLNERSKCRMICG